MNEVALPIGVLVFGLLVVGMQVLIMLRRKKGWGVESTRLVGITVVVTAAVFVSIVSQIDQNRLTAVIGLLATIAGYLLGRSDKTPTSPPSK